MYAFANFFFFGGKSGHPTCYHVSDILHLEVWTKPNPEQLNWFIDQVSHGENTVGRHGIVSPGAKP